MSKFERITAICLALVCVTVAGCEPGDPNPDTTEFQAELEQMENQIGRLEFRVFELEQRLGEITGDSVRPDSAPPTTASPADQDRYDLTPVE